MFSTLPMTNFNFCVTIILSSANPFNMDKSKILSFGKRLMHLKSVQSNINQKLLLFVNYEHVTGPRYLTILTGIRQTKWNLGVNHYVTTCFIYYDEKEMPGTRTKMKCWVTCKDSFKGYNVILYYHINFSHKISPFGIIW